MHGTDSESLALAAARLIVDEGLDFDSARRKAARQAERRGGARPELPDNEQIEDRVREHLALFCAETQPAELRALRELALTWMRRLAEFRPHLSGAVWRGTATRQSDIHLDLYCDDGKAAEIALLNRGVDFDVGSRPGPRHQSLDVLTVMDRCPALGQRVALHLTVRDHDDLRGALKPDSRGRSWRGDADALQRRLAQPDVPAGADAA